MKKISININLLKLETFWKKMKNLITVGFTSFGIMETFGKKRIAKSMLLKKQIVKFWKLYFRKNGISKSILSCKNRLMDFRAEVSPKGEEKKLPKVFFSLHAFRIPTFPKV